MDIQSLVPIFYAFLGGLIPTLIWLYFWTREAGKDPEPKSIVALSFIGGMVAVVISLILEKYFYNLGLKHVLESCLLSHIVPWFETILKNINASIAVANKLLPIGASKQQFVTLDNLLLVTMFAPFIEEVSKFVMSYVLVLSSKFDNKPIDPMIYLISTALGFAAIENMLFLIGPFSKQDYLATLFTGNMRFIGATLVHTTSSAIIAMFISFHFFYSKIKKDLYIIAGIISAIIVHGTFNYMMIGNSQNSILALEFIWVIVIIILLAFEKIKKIRKEQILLA